MEWYLLLIPAGIVVLAFALCVYLIRKDDHPAVRHIENPLDRDAVDRFLSLGDEDKNNIRIILETFDDDPDQ